MPEQGDVLLTNNDSTSNVLPIKLFKESSRVEGGYERSTIPFALPPQPQDDSSAAAVSPDIARIWDARDWSEGAFQVREARHGESGRYAYTDGVLATEGGELTLGYQKDEVDILLKNGRFETGESSDWTENSATISVTSGVLASSILGSHYAVVTSAGAGSSITQGYGGTVSVFQSREITLYALVRRDSGSGQCRLTLDDDVAVVTNGTYTSSTTWTTISVTRTIDAAATTITFGVEFDTDGDVWHVDNIGVVPTGGIVFKSGLVEFGGSAYIACGRCILKWNENDLAWYAMYCDSAYVISDLEKFSTDGTARMYAGRGTDTNYLTSTDGTTWSNPSTNSGNNRLASFLSTGKNTLGEWALFKTRGNKIAMTTDPTDTANWSSEVQVGDDNAAITSLFPARGPADLSELGLVLVGKEDGLYVYRSSTNLFEALNPEGGTFTDPENLAVAVARGDEIYACGTDRTFWRIPITGGEWRALTELTTMGSMRGVGGKVSAITQDSHNIWIAMPNSTAGAGSGFPYTFPIDFSVSSGLSGKASLIATVQDKKDELGRIIGKKTHTIQQVHAVDLIRQMGRFKDTSNSLSNLFVFGEHDNGVTDQPRVARFRIPQEHAHPALVGTRAINKHGAFYSSWSDSGFPDAPKASAKLTITSKNLSSAKFLTVYYKADNATDDDTANWILYGTGTVNTSPVQVLSAPTTNPLIHRRIRFKVEFETDSTTDDPPRVESITHHTVVCASCDYRVWEIDTIFEDDNMPRTARYGQASSKPLATVLSDLDTLSNRPFVRFVDIDETEYRVRISRSPLRPLTNKAINTSGVGTRHRWLQSLRLTEVKTS